MKNQILLCLSNGKNIFYQKIKEGDVEKIVEKTVLKGEIIEDFL